MTEEQESHPYLSFLTELKFWSVLCLNTLFDAYQVTGEKQKNKYMIPDSLFHKSIG